MHLVVNNMWIVDVCHHMISFRWCLYRSVFIAVISLNSAEFRMVWWYIKKVKVKAVDLYSASSCTPKAGGQAGGPAVPPLMRSRHGPGAAGHTGHCPQPAHTGLGSDLTVGQTAPVSSRSPPP